MTDPKKNTFLSEIKYAFYLIFHPFKGFWEIKREKKGSLRTATVILISYLVVMVLTGLYTGYLFQKGNALYFNVPREVFKFLLLFFCCCISNWGFTCLFDGEGSMQDVYKATAYSLLPLVIINIALLPMSNFFVLAESALYTAFSSIAIGWTLFLIVIGMLVTHQYTLGKTIISVICTILGMCIIAYIGLLFFNLLQQVLGFIATIIQEVELRWS